MKHVEIGSRRDDRHLVRRIAIIKLVLLFDFIAGAGNDQIGISQRILFGVDTARHMIAQLDILHRQAHSQQPAAFIASQRMAGMDQRQTRPMRKAHTHITGVGIMAVQNIRQAWLTVQPRQ